MKDNSEHRLLVCTLGGSPEPVVESINHWEPEMIFFIVSPESQEQIETIKNKIKEKYKREVSPREYEIFRVVDAQSFSECVKTIREEVDKNIKKWQEKCGDCQIIIDFTGGTKCMTAALAIVSQRWRCEFSYVGGTERNKGGVGIVVDGKERVLHSHNPYDSLGFMAIERAVFHFDRLAFSLAKMECEEAKKKIHDKKMKNLLISLGKLAEAYQNWDKFQHKTAYNLLNELSAYKSYLIEQFHHKKEYVIRKLEDNREFLKSLAEEKEKPSINLLKDLLANAQRRKEEGFFDDAVARLYRFTEALAQLRLKRYNINSTKDVLLEKLPPKLQESWRNKSENGLVTLGLQQAYRLLYELGDDVGKKFIEMGWLNMESKGNKKSRSPLEARNSSILAHGFDPVTEDTFNSLWIGVVELAEVAGIDIKNLPHFIKLGE